MRFPFLNIYRFLLYGFALLLFTAGIIISYQYATLSDIVLSSADGTQAQRGFDLIIFALGLIVTLFYTIGIVAAAEFVRLLLNVEDHLYHMRYDLAKAMRPKTPRNRPIPQADYAPAGGAAKVPSSRARLKQGSFDAGGFAPELRRRYEQGMKEYQRGNYEEAIVLFNFVLERDANFAPAYRYRSLSYYAIGKSKEAEQDMRKYHQYE